jgi:hypothetical protein
MMQFRTLKDSIVNILGAAEAGRYTTVGFQRQSSGGSEINASPKVAVYYQSGEFATSRGRYTGTVMHDCTFTIELSVATAAKVDLSTLDDPGSSAIARAAALSALQESAKLADDAWDELLDTVYQVLMDARNIDMGLSVGDVSNRWIPRAQKDNPVPRGEFVMLTGRITMEARVAEEVVGDTGTPGTAYDVTLEQDGDPNLNAGAAGTLGGT